MLPSDRHPKPSIGSCLKDSLVPLSSESFGGNATETAHSNREQHILPLISQALAPLLEQSQANSNAIARIEQSIASLTTERQSQANSRAIARIEQSIASLTTDRTSGMETTSSMEAISLLTSCLEKAVDDVRQQASVLRTSQQEMACNNQQPEQKLLAKNAVTFENIPDIGRGRTAESAAAVMTCGELRQQQQQQQQPKHRMITDDDWPPETVQTEPTDGSATHKKAKVRKQSSFSSDISQKTYSMEALDRTELAEDPHARRLGKRKTATPHSKKSSHSSAKNLRMDVAFLEHEASLPIARAFFRRIGRILDWWISLEEPNRSGPLFDFVHSRKFDMIVACVITANSVTMTLAANHNMKTHNEGQFVYAEWCFVILYILELAAKLSVHGAWIFYNEDALWNIFDTVLVGSSVYDTIVQFLAMTAGGAKVDAKMGLMNLRILRLIRVFRVLRLLRIFNEAWLLVQTVISSFVHLLWSMLILAFLFYVFAMVIIQDLIISREKAKPDLEIAIAENFGSVQKAMLSLFKSISTGEVWNTYLQLLSPFSACLLVFFVTLVQFQISNILTAIVIQNTQRIHTPDALTQASMDATKHEKESEELWQLVKLADNNNDGCISARELQEAVEQDEDIKIQFRSLGLDLHDLQKFFDLLVEHLPDGHRSEHVDIQRFVEAFMRMKGAAKVVTQETLLMETRALSQSQARHNLNVKNWQREVNQKLEVLRSHR